MDPLGSREFTLHRQPWGWVKGRNEMTKPNPEKKLGRALKLKGLIDR